MYCTVKIFEYRVTSDTETNSHMIIIRQSYGYIREYIGFFSFVIIVVILSYNAILKSPRSDTSENENGLIRHLQIK